MMHKRGAIDGVRNARCVERTIEFRRGLGLGVAWRRGVETLDHKRIDGRRFRQAVSGFE